VINFLWAVTVDAVTVWAPLNKWTAVLTLVAMLEARNLSSFTLAATLNRPNVTEQRLLRGAVACLGPAIVVHRHLPVLLEMLLQSLHETMANYETFVDDKYEEPRSDEASSSSDGDDGGDVDEAGDGDDNEGEDDISRVTMANAHPHHVFSAMQYTKTWLRRVATAAGFKALYNEEGNQDDDILKTGIWAPGLPILRAPPNFVGASVADTDLAACNHEMGKEKVYTGGSFGAFCTCMHPHRRQDIGRFGGATHAPRVCAAEVCDFTSRNCLRLRLRDSQDGDRAPALRRQEGQDAGGPLTLAQVPHGLLDGHVPRRAQDDERDQHFVF